MMYVVKIPFATLRGSYSEGDVVADIEDAENLAKAGIIQAIEDGRVTNPPVQDADEVEPKPITKGKRK
jgi:hypothetical protein